MANTVGESLEQSFRYFRDMDGSLKERLDAFSNAVRERRPAFQDVADRLVSRLAQNGAGQSAPKPGELMPPFLLPNENGRLVSSEDLLTKGPLAITFHRGHWCPYCRINLKALVDVRTKIAETGGQLVAIMPDLQEYASEFKSDANAPFPILTDIDNGYAMSLNLVISLGEKMERMLESIGRALPQYHGNNSWMVPIPATFVVGMDGRICARFVDPDYRKRMAIEDLLAGLHSAGKARSLIDSGYGTSWPGI